MIGLPVTLATAVALTVIFVTLTVQVGVARGRSRISLGGAEDGPLAFGAEGGASALRLAIRAHANFAEFVPLCLVLLGLLEIGGGSRTVVGGLGALLVLGRVLHPLGLTRPVPNPFRGGGAGLTLLVLVGGAVYGVVLLMR